MKFIIQFVQLIVSNLTDYQLIELIITSVIVIEVLSVIIMLRKIIKKSKMMIIS